MEITGLDLGSAQIKFVTLKKETRELLAYGAAPLNGLSLESEAPDDLKKYAALVRELAESQAVPFNLVCVGLPEAKVFNQLFAVPKMSDKELAGAVSFELEQYLPLPIKDVVYDFRVVEELEGGKKQNIQALATPKELAAKYAKIVSLANLTLVGLEPETAALARSCVDEAASPIATLVVSLGAASTDLAIVYGGVVRFTRSIGTGGEALTRAVAQNLSFEAKQAEEYKRTYGLDETELEGKISKALKPVFDLIIEEIKRALAYYQTHEVGSPTLKRLVVCGGAAAMPGALVYIAQSLNLEAQLANPWLKIKNSGNFTSQELETAGPSFAVAAGLALKDF